MNNSILKTTATTLSETFLTNVWNDTDLYKSTFKAPDPAIDHLIYDGVTVLGGAPKSGKSILVEQMAYAVATGIDLFNCHAQQGEVLYLNLESDPANALARRKAMGLPETGHINYYFSNDLNLQSIENVALETKKGRLGLIIIDTLQKIRGCCKSADEYSYSEAVRDIDVLQRLSKHINVPVLVVHHTKKDSNDLLGSQGIFATVSSKLIVLREEAAKSGQLSIVSRFHPSHTLDLKFQEKPLGWILDDEPHGDIVIDPIVTAIMAFLSKQENETWQGTTKELWVAANLARYAADPARL
ncbi:MAG: AAA family ATPase, partial [Eubacterium limosum]|nr:AAA family ATPase [Eubacterium limosum]